MAAENKGIATEATKENQANDTEIVIGADLRDVIASIKAIESGLNTYINKHEELDSDIHGSNGLSDDIAGLKESLSKSVEEVATCTQSCKTHGKLIHTLSAIIIRQQGCIDSMQSSIEELKSRLMRDNIIIHNVKETPRENVLEATRHALEKNGYVLNDINFERIHRSGPMLQNKPRPIIAKPHRYTHTEQLVRRKLTPAIKTGAWISPQYTEQVRERLRQLGKMASSTKVTDPTAEVSLKFNQLTVNKQAIKSDLEPPSTANILNLTEDEKRDLEKIKFTTTRKWVNIHRENNTSS